MRNMAVLEKQTRRDKVSRLYDSPSTIYKLQMKKQKQSTLDEALSDRVKPAGSIQKKTKKKQKAEFEVRVPRIIVRNLGFNVREHVYPRTRHLVLHLGERRAIEETIRSARLSDQQSLHRRQRFVQRRESNHRANFAFS